MTIQKIGVVGSGIMGAGVAEVAAASGAVVIVRTRSRERTEAVLAQVASSLRRQVERATRSEGEAAAILGRVHASEQFTELAQCQLVIETVVEDLAVKRELFRHIDEVVPPDTIIASCTSTLPIIDLAAEVSFPERVCGVHFFNPVPSMALVEVVRTLVTSDATLEAVRAFVRRCAKEPVDVADRAGFIVNALLFPYLNNAIRLFESGVATKEGIDVAMKGGCGFPMGPFTLLDLVGLDTSLAILEALYGEYGEPNYAPAPLLRRLVSAGRLGRKTGAGFYDYAAR